MAKKKGLSVLDVVGSIVAPVPYWATKETIHALNGDHPKVGEAGPGSDVNNTAPTNYFDERAKASHDQAYGTDQQHQTQDRQDPGKWLQDQTDTEQRLFDPNAQPGAVQGPNVPTDWFPPLGTIAQADARDRAIIDGQQGNVSAYQDYISKLTGDLGTTYAGLDARDNATLDQLTSTLNGIPLVSSQGAQAYADPQAIAAQADAMGMLKAAANGSLDVHTNPEDLAHQNLALSKLLPLTDMHETAQERFLMERARQGEEMDRHAAMNAALNNLAMRGMLGSGHEIGAMLGSQQITSQNRMLQDLGAEANAIDRQMKALGMYSDLSTNMRNESDAVSSGNSNRRLSGTQGYSNAAGDMRTSSFDEAYKRGQAADVVSMNNQAFQRGRADDIASAGLRVTGQSGDRAGSLAGLSATGAGNALTAQTNQTGLNLQAGGAHDARVAAEQGRQDHISDQEHAAQIYTQAMADLQKKHGILGFGFGPDILSNGFNI